MHIASATRVHDSIRFFSKRWRCCLPKRQYSPPKSMAHSSAQPTTDVFFFFLFFTTVRSSVLYVILVMEFFGME